MRIPCNPCSTGDAAADGISDGLQVIHRRHQQRLTGDLSHVLSQHRYEAGNAEDGVWEMTLCNPCSNRDAATDGISDGLQVTGVIHSDSTCTKPATM